MEKKAQLIIAQIDHLSGEMLGLAIDRLLEYGASNVQIIPTITKKNRPGNLLIVDAVQEQEEIIAGFLLKELQVTGYHRIETNHVFQRVGIITRQIHARKNNAGTAFSCEVKITGEPSEPLSVAIEHNALVNAQEIIKRDLDCCIALHELRALIESRLRGSGEIVLEL